MSQFQFGRLIVSPPIQWHEQLGDPVTNLGGSPVPSPRSALRHAVTISTFAADGAVDTVAARLILRKQMRSILNNTPLKLQGYLYIQYSDDPEQNGWYVPDQGSLTDGDGASGLATGWWKLDSVVWMLAGHLRTHREARNVWMKDLRTGLFWRDTMKWIYSTDFAALPGLQLTVLPHGAISAMNTVTTGVVGTVALPVGRDGGVCQLATGQSDLATISYERPEASLNLSDVVVYDRMGKTDVAPVYSVAVLEDNPVSYWRMDETSGTTMVDQMGANSGLYIVGTTLNTTPGALTGSGDTDACVAFNGSTGTVNVADTPSLDFTTALTMEAWIHPTGVAASQGVMGKGGGSNGYNWAINATAGITVQIGSTSVPNGSPILSAGVWQHVVITYNAGTVNWYVNGKLVFTSTGTFATSITGSPGTLLSIGFVSGIAGHVGGNIDEVAVYNYALTAQQVATHYYAGTNTFGAGVDPQKGFGWSEVYGSDWPWNWQIAGQPNDTPVLDNGLVRVRYDASVGHPGFKVDVWNGASYVEQGKMVFQHFGGSAGICDTFVSAGLHTDNGYTPDRATMAVVLALAADPLSRERIFITVERGSLGVTFEYYPAILAAGTQNDCILLWAPVNGDANDSAMKIDSLGATPLPSWTPGAAVSPQNTTWTSSAKMTSTAGTGSALFGSATNLGTANFTVSENWVAMLRCITGISTLGPYQHNLAVQQAANIAAYTDSTSFGTGAYGVAANDLAFTTGNAGHVGYATVTLAFAATQADQVMEGESITLGTNTVSTVDAVGSNGHAATSTRVTDANFHVSRATWPNGFLAQYRVFIRAKVSANSASFYCKTGATTGVTVTSTSTSYIWIDLGEIVTNNTTMEIHAWMSGGAGTVSVDRIEAFATQDRTRNGAIDSGARDNGQAALFDSRQLGAVVSR